MMQINRSGSPDRLYQPGSLRPFVRFGSLADKPSKLKIRHCPLLSESGHSRLATHVDWRVHGRRQKTGTGHRAKGRHEDETDGARRIPQADRHRLTIQGSAEDWSGFLNCRGETEVNKRQRIFDARVFNLLARLISLEPAHSRAAHSPRHHFSTPTPSVFTLGGGAARGGGGMAGDGDHDSKLNDQPSGSGAASQSALQPGCSRYCSSPTS
jgi:hypothetical protein